MVRDTEDITSQRFYSLCQSDASLLRRAGHIFLSFADRIRTARLRVQSRKQ